MNRLTEEEIAMHIKPRDKDTGVEAITREMLESIDLDTVPEIERTRWGDICVNGYHYNYDSFIPRAGSHAFKPSFAGAQVLIGKEGRILIFSNGRWFLGKSMEHISYDIKQKKLEEQS